MAQTSPIEWTDATWNPVRGCSRVSPGCGGPGARGGCYAERIAARFSGPGMAYEGLAEMVSGKARWTGELSFGHDLEAPLRWRTPRRIFVNSMSDLFHPKLGIPEIATVYAISVAAHLLRGHTMQMLTKRPDRMRRVLNDPAFWEQVNMKVGAHVLARTDPLDRRTGDGRARCQDYSPRRPPPGIWLGVSTEDQDRAEERIPDLLATPAAVHFVSAEPLLGQVMPWTFSIARRAAELIGCTLEALPSLDLVIAGGESGPRARPANVDWIRLLRDLCAATGAAFFFKQWGEWAPEALAFEGCWPVDRWHTWPASASHLCLPAAAVRIGRAKAGRLLDGVEHNGMPGASSPTFSRSGDPS